MKPFAYNLEALLYARDMKQEALAAEIGYSQSAVSKWMRGEREPSMPALHRLCETYALTMEDLTNAQGGLYEQVTGNLPPRRELDTLDNARRSQYLGRHRYEYRVVNLGVVATVPPATERRFPDAYYLQVPTDTVDRLLPKGCIALVDPTLEPRSGDLVAVGTDEEPTFWRYLKASSMTILAPHSGNPEHTDQVFQEGEDIDLVGVVVWFQAAGELR